MLSRAYFGGYPSTGSGDSTITHLAITSSSRPPPAHQKRWRSVLLDGACSSFSQLTPVSSGGARLSKTHFRPADRQRRGPADQLPAARSSAAAMAALSAACTS